MIKKVVLVYPRARRYSAFLSTHRLPGLVTCHAGLTILAQLLERMGLDVRVYDEQITPFSDRLLDGCDLLGLSVQTTWAPRAYAIAARARRRGVPVVLGGVHATLNPGEAVQHADLVVRGEGERTLPELIRALDSGAGLGGILGLTWRDGDRVRDNPARPLLDTAELDALPWPRLDLVQGLTAARHPLNRLVYFTMVTRGCDQACTFCSITRVFGQALRKRSVQGVVEELGARFDPERQFLFFMDDSLAVDPEYLKELLAALIDHRLVPRLGWHSQLRAQVADDPELLALMRRTNCLFVTCGFESIDPRTLRVLGKGQSPEDVARAIRRLREHGIVVNGFFMFGTDHDGPGAVARTVEFAQRSGCMLAGFMPLTPFPGTPTFTQLEREGRIFTKDWELYDVQHVVFHPRRQSALELYRDTLLGYPRFYAPHRGWLDHLVTGLARRPGLAVMAVGASWPLAKAAYWSREVAANVDYLRALRRLEAGGWREPFPDLSAAAS